MDVSTTTPRTQALLLLCGHFGQKAARTARPLSLKEYNALAVWLHDQGMGPEDLLSREGEASAAASGVVKDAPERLPALLERGMALAFSADEWAREGIWVIGRGDDDYPRSLRARLGRDAPVLLFGVGATDLLHAPAIGAVGSRDADPAALAFASRLGARCARDGWTLVSGAAKGVDRESMLAAVDAGGTALGILAEGVSKPSRSRLFRERIANGYLTLVSVVAPGARWQVGQAMGRNKYIYGLSRATVVVSSGTDGGTWSGAVENLRQQWVPMWVRRADAVPPGNTALLSQGAHPIDASDLNAPDLLDRLVAPAARPTEIAPSTHAAGDGMPEVTPTLFDAVPTKPTRVEEPSVQPEGGAESTHPTQVMLIDVFGAVWPLMERALSEPSTEADVAEQLDVVTTQARAWLKRAIDEGRVVKRTRPTRYELAS